MQQPGFQLEMEIQNGFDSRESKTITAFQFECVFKKCCEKYKKGKRCKKCPKG